MQLLLKHRLSSAFESAATLGAQRREWQFGAIFYARLSTDSHSGSVHCVYVPVSKLFLWETFASVKTQREMQVLICPRMACLQTAIWHLSCAKTREFKSFSCTVAQFLASVAVSPRACEDGHELDDKFTLLSSVSYPSFAAEQLLQTWWYFYFVY